MFLFPVPSKCHLDRAKVFREKGCFVFGTSMMRYALVKASKLGGQQQQRRRHRYLLRLTDGPAPEDG